ncbi:MAG: DUF5723 family protein [Bacteroidales bacterium]|nr:DUF5723 family protein [Bacteroidales bacterium]MCF8386490.1 DUF5723 family protein [Bacteroidales bacterium]MCF8397106.1 DUF5723 family protein [Bacteroidales bacterium]
MKRFTFLIAAMIFLAASQSYSQLEYSAFTQSGSAYSVTAATDYQCLGINPANLGWKRNLHSWNLGFAEVGSMVYSEPLTKEQVNKDLFGGESKKFEDYATNPADRMEAVDKFTDARLLGHASVMLFGISYQDEKIGGIAFAIRSRLVWNSILNETASRFLFLGYNDDTYFEKKEDEEGVYGEAINPESSSQLYYPSHLEHLWYNEYVLGYGRTIVDNENFKLFGGVAFKYLQGYGNVYVDIDSENSAEGYQALSPFYKVDYGDNKTPSELTGDGLKTAGSGFGFDLGLTFLMQNKLKFAIAVNDIGTIKWDANVYKGHDPDVDIIRSAGLSSYNIFSEAGDVISDNTNVGEWEGLNELKISLPTNLRAGASYRIDEQWEAGADFYYAIESGVAGAYRDPVFGLGTRYDPAKWVQLSLGFISGGQFGWGLPFGATFRPFNNENTSWEVGFAFRDLTSVFKDEDPLVSYCMGLMRFSFGYEEEEKRFLDE